MSRKTGIRDVLGRDTVHPFPARMAPSLALSVLGKMPKRGTVLDPMVGSGTVLALARARGHRAIGFDIDPLAVLISTVWTRTLDRKVVRLSAQRTLGRARKIARTITYAECYPQNACVETKRFVRYWFDPHARRQLAALSRAILAVKSRSVRDVLWCGFSRLIIAKQAGASLAMDLAHSRPHKVFKSAPRKPFSCFLTQVERVIAASVDKNDASRGPVASAKPGDARCLPVPDRSIDLVLTSPPYLNAIDYLRCSKFSLVWMGFSIPQLRHIRRNSIGAEVGATQASSRYDELIEDLGLAGRLSPRMGQIMRRYVDDTKRSLVEVARVLKTSGKVVFVLGENTIRKSFIRTGKMVTTLAKGAGLQLVSRRTRRLPDNRRYLPPPAGGKANLDSRMSREVILTFKRARKKRSRSAMKAV